MLFKLLTKIVGTKNERELNRLSAIVDRINQLEPNIRKLSDAQLKEKTKEFKEKLERGATLDDLLPEAFAVVREAAVRVLGQRPFDVQVIGGIVLHEGKIAEMKTGEGKTLAATMPAYLNALLGKGVHIVTVNDYLAKRDSEWMGGIYRFLGLEVGVILHDMDDIERKKAYDADITYGTNNEFGFDYLRDNMKFDISEVVQRGHYYAIVDEVDSILIDEARTPLIISGPAERSTALFYQINRLIPHLKKDIDFTLDEKTKTAALTEAGVAKMEKLLKIENLYDPRYIEVLHVIYQCLRAHHLFKKDRDYIVKDGKVIIVDEFTGRLMPGRRYSEGLHQALEAKEGVEVQSEYQTLATITFQNYFRMYEKLAGMTGTAETEAAEFKEIYNLDVVVIPTHKEMIRIDYPDVIYKTERAKFKAVVREIKELYKQGRPVLVGTVSIEKSERLSEMLKKEGIPHAVLNAKHHAKEAEIVALAGQKGRVTIATNMAGRGTDIVLGEGVAELGGLHIIGTERHESRRIDNQLRGRAGRQGDPGSSRFYLSLEDDLLRLFGGERLSSLMDRFGMNEDEPIEHKWVSKAIENAQKRVEAHNFEIRKQLLEYDDVLNEQREIIYRQRREAMAGNLKETILGMIEDVAERLIETYCPKNIHPEEWDYEGLKKQVEQTFNLSLEKFNPYPSSQEALYSYITEMAKNAYFEKEKLFGSENMRFLERYIVLQVVDTLWREHLISMDYLREGIGLRGYGQKDPLQEYKREGFMMFHEMIERIKEQTIAHLFRVEIRREEEIADLRPETPKDMRLSHGEETKRTPVRRKTRKIGRNEPCPCGSGKKYKHCCGRNV
ncbi:MAG: preprotein translocase subunit SecA [Candidatus Desulfofervidus auxilii]|nr:preprotein translocase subunit SecA [Candidatus Desulfofervidus auxilii]